MNMYCSKCGAHMMEKAVFCPECGRKVIGNENSKKDLMEENKKICCPRCGRCDLVVYGNRDMGTAVMSGMAVSVFAGPAAGLLTGAIGLQQKIYWVCKDCGRKFRDLDELSSETLAYEKRAKGF